MNKNTSLLCVVTTCGTKEDADSLARLVVERHIAACAQVSGPITSIYWWKGQMEEEQEWQVRFKILASSYQLVQDAIRKNHPYELPQIVAFGIEEALPEFAQWVAENSEGK